MDFEEIIKYSFAAVALVAVFIACLSLLVGIITIFWDVCAKSLFNKICVLYWQVRNLNLSIIKKNTDYYKKKEKFIKRRCEARKNYLKTITDDISLWGQFKMNYVAVSLVVASVSAALFIVASLIIYHCGVPIRLDNVVLTFVGIIATFLVVTNYAQVLEIKKEFEQKTENLRKVQDNKEKKLKEDLLTDTSIKLRQIEQQAFNTIVRYNAATKNDAAYTLAKKIHERIKKRENAKYQLKLKTGSQIIAGLDWKDNKLIVNVNSYTGDFRGDRDQIMEIEGISYSQPEDVDIIIQTLLSIKE